jgi:DNA-binding transcriptional LysR family regulator
MNLIDLEAFVSVVDHGSIVRAATALHLTQSAVTRRVQNLEDALGVPLLDRLSRPLKPTSAGMGAYDFAKPVLSSVGDLKAAISHDGEPSGDFRFGMSRGLGDLAFASPVRSLRAEFPKIRLRAYIQWGHLLLERLANRSLDAAVVLLSEETQPPANLNAVQLGTRRLQVIAGKCLKLPTNVSLEELSKHPWVLNPHGCATRQVLERALQQHGLPFDCSVEAEGHELQFSLIAQGVGLGAAIPDVLQASAFREEIKILKVKEFLVPHRIWLLSSKHVGRLAPVLQCLKVAVQETLSL